MMRPRPPRPYSDYILRDQIQHLADEGMSPNDIATYCGVDMEMVDWALHCCTSCGGHTILRDGSCSNCDY